MSNTVLIPEDVLAIMERLDAGDSGVEISRDFAVSQQTVSSIKTGECWGHVTGLAPRNPGEHTNRGKLTRSEVMEIDAGLREGVRPVELARRYGVSHCTIYQLRLGQTWAWLTGRPRCESRTA
jgi:hypothetical protein